MNFTAFGRYMIWLIAVAAAYVLLAEFGFSLASINASTSPIWAPSGLALAAFLTLGARIWPAIFVGAFLANFTATPDAAAFVVALGNTAEGLIMAALLARFAGGARTFETPSRIACFGMVALLSGTMVAATVGVSALCFFGHAPWSGFPALWATWWLGDSAGALGVAPVIVLWAQSLREAHGAEAPVPVFTRATAIVFLSAAVVGLLAFSPLFEHSFIRVPLAFLAIVPLFAAALRLGQRDTATVALVLSSFAVWGTVSGSGPFVQADINNSFLLLLTFMISVTVPSLALSAEVAQRRQAEHDLRHQEGELRAVFRQALVGIAECDTVGRFLSVNEKMCDMMRRSEEELLAARMLDLTDAEDASRENEVFARTVSAQEGYAIEKRIVWPDATKRWVRNTVTPIVDRMGRVRRVAVICEDITQRHNDEERQKLLMAELNHRVRNNLATIQAITRLTARGPSSKAEYAESLQGRVSSMARAHSLLTRDNWQGANLQDIVRDELSTYARFDAVTIDGPSITLGTRHAIDLALVVHELSTNAIKHGALSAPSGRLAISWTNRMVAGEPHLVLRWEETDGPQTQAPTKKGFGIYLIETALSGGGTKVSLDFPPDGVKCLIDMPMVRTEPAASPPPPQPVPATPSRRPGRRGRVLLVEDDAVLGFELQSALSDAGLDVIGPARTVQEALVLAADKDLLAAVLDIHLGGVMVFPVAEYLQRNDVPILFITGYDIDTVAPETLRHVPVMQKPVNANDLVGRVKHLVGAA